MNKKVLTILENINKIIEDEGGGMSGGISAGVTDASIEAAVPQTAISLGKSTTKDKTTKPVEAPHIDKYVDTKKGEVIYTKEKLINEFIKEFIFKESALDSSLHKSKENNINKNFIEWFKDSKVVNENGDPLIVYHCSDADFSVFDVGTKTSYINNDLLGNIEVDRTGSFFSENLEFAKHYGQKVYEVYLSIQNPANLNDDNIRFDFVETIDAFEERDLWLSAKHKKTAWQLFDNELGPRFIQFLKNNGYDGATFEEEIEDDVGTTWVVFDSNQIKSKDAKSFNSHSDNIYESKLQELFDADIPLKKNSYSRDIVYSFSLNDIEYNIMFSELDKNEDITYYDMWFTADDSTDLTGKGNAPQVFSACLKALKDFLKKVKNENFVLSFSAKASDLSRVKLYDIFAKRIAKEFGFNLTERWGFESTAFSSIVLGEEEPDLDFVDEDDEKTKFYIFRK